MCRDTRWRRSWPVLWCLPSRRRAWGAGGEGGPWKGMERCYYYYRQSVCCCGRVYCPGGWCVRKNGFGLLPSPYARKTGGRAGLQLARELMQSCGFAMPLRQDIKTSLRPRVPARERMARAPRLRQKCLVRNGRSQPDDRRVDVHVGAGGREADAVLLLLLVPQRPGVASRGEQGATTGAIRPPAPTHQSCRVLVAHRPTLCGPRGGAAGVCTL